MGKRQQLNNKGRDFNRNGSANTGAGASITQSFADMFQTQTELDVSSVWVSADPILLDEISPDPAQPRRAIPTGVRYQTPNASPADRSLFDAWLGVIADESGATISLTDLFNAAPDDDAPFEALDFAGKQGPAKRAFIELLTLAYSIRRDGLANPITVFQKQQPNGEYHYQIESGERRWMAYWMLRHYDAQPEKWQRIPAIVADAFNPFRQASENMARANLNAIGRARQYAVLLMAMHGDHTFAAYEEASSDRAYYAQASNLKVPYGSNRALLEAFGIRSRSVFTKLRQVLEVDDELWRRADDEDWSEDRLFTVMNNSAGEATKPAATAQTANPLADRAVRKRFNRVFKHLQRGSETDIPDDDLDAIEAWLKQVREQKQGDRKVVS
jgi:ParB/RepB/Spo0J family partition protein